MDVFEQEERAPDLVGYPAAIPGAVIEPAKSLALAGPAEAPVAVGERAAPDDADETIFSVLAGRARTRARAHLWITAGIGGIDAVALTIARPSLWWVAAACAAVSAYAIWGLADRALTHSGENLRGWWAPRVVRGIRGLAVVVGVTSVVAAAMGFLGAALGNSGPPG